MADREKLVELCEDVILSCKASMCDDCEHSNIDYPHCMGVHFADHLLANGVVVREKGEWKYIGGGEWCCSVCGYVVSTEGRWEPMMDDFCRGCGSDMRKEKPEA